MGAAPSGSPGCPELAFWTVSIARVRIVLTQSSVEASLIGAQYAPLSLSAAARVRRGQGERSYYAPEADASRVEPA